MKTVFRLGSLIVAAVVIFGASHLWAENKAKKPVAPRTRIGLLNLTFVIKNYDKYKQFQDEVKVLLEPFQTKDADLRQQLAELRKRAEAQPSQREELERQAKDIQRKMEDNGLAIKLKLGKKSDEEMQLLYKDVAEAVERYATAHDLELVLHYNDAVTKKEFDSAKNIARKLNTGSLMPIYMVSGIDISTEIVDDLNQHHD